MPTKIPFNIQCQIIADGRQFARLLPAWEALWARCGHPVFGAPVWIDAWWRFIGQTQGVRLAIVAVQRGDELVGVFPWCIVRRRKVFRVLEWCAWEVIDHCGPLIEPSTEREATLEAARAAIWRAGGFDFAALYQVPTSDPFAHWASRHMRKLPVVAEVYEFARENTDSEKYLADQHNRKAYRKSAHAISTKVGDVVLKTLFTDDDAKQMLTRLFDLKEQWIARRDEQERDQHAARRPFLEHVLPVLMRAGCASLTALQDDEGAPLAGGVVLQEGNTLMFYYTVSDDRHNVPSPGTVFYIDVMSWALVRGFKRVDFLRGQYEYKRKLSNGTYQLFGFVRARTLLGILGTHLLSWRVKQGGETPVIAE